MYKVKRPTVCSTCTWTIFAAKQDAWFLHNPANTLCTVILCNSCYKFQVPQSVLLFQYTFAFTFYHPISLSLLHSAMSGRNRQEMSLALRLAQLLSDGSLKYLKSMQTHSRCEQELWIRDCLTGVPWQDVPSPLTFLGVHTHAEKKEKKTDKED